jgi:excinuclease ABC subunit C
MDVKEKVRNFPDSAGVYLMKDRKGEVIYVGKAASLKKRVSSYFRERPFSPRLAALIENIADIGYIPTTDEAQALLFEAALIKSRQPRYNVALRDDKNYPLLKLTLNEKYPRLLIARTKKADGSVYFGPYTSAKLLRQALSFLRCVFPLRVCRRMPKTACLNYYLRQCIAPCIDKTDPERYSEIVNQLIMFLEGGRPELLRQLEKRMSEASKEKRYEEAARIRDQIRALTQFIVARGQAPGARGQLEALKEILNLGMGPERIEAFDVSNISGKEAVGSMVVFVDGTPYKNGYRKFRIKEVRGIDDYGMMKEIVRRRYQKLIDEKQPLPGLIIIDGGRGHLSSAKEELDKLGLTDVPVMSIAKEFEHIFVPTKTDPIKLPANSPALYLIQSVRDEAHRFAIGYHKKLRSRLTEISVLDDIRGIGPQRKRALLKYFGSVDGMKKANKADLLKIKGVNKQLAEKIKQSITRG